jgi:HEAT repeat protein
MQLRPFGRRTPSAGTPESGLTRVVTDARVALAVARALGALVDRIAVLGDPDLALRGTDQPQRDPAIDQVREALRQLAARAREGSLMARMEGGALTIDGVPDTAAAVATDARLVVLQERLRRRGVGTLAVREGAAPGELLTLGHALASDRPIVPSPRDTPAQGSALTAALAAGDALSMPRELLRSWSVLVTAAGSDAPRPHLTPPTSVPAGSGAAQLLGRLAAARTADAVAAAVDALIALVDDAERRGDEVLLEGIATALMARAMRLGADTGRLACEDGLRRLLRPVTIALLARRLPVSADRELLLAVLARAGDAAVAALLDQLTTVADPSARRICFDAIIALDTGVALLRRALDDDRWFVVRNAAALLGETQSHGADELLAVLLGRDDARVRIAAARALIRLRTSRALTALQAALTDALPEVRRLAATAYALAGHLPGTHRPPAAPLVHALETEDDEDVALEMIAALGRLGSADAVQRLLRIAQLPLQDATTGERPAPQPSWMRIAALEALMQARGHALDTVLAELRDDPDEAVAEAAGRLAGTGPASR